jgi:ferredoxin
LRHTGTSRQAVALRCAIGILACNPLRHRTNPPAVTQPIRRVWIEEGCISCKVCEDLAPQVFLVDGDAECIVKPDAAAHFAPLADEIEQAAKDCPVEVIKFES